MQIFFDEANNTPQGETLFRCTPFENWFKQQGAPLVNAKRVPEVHNS